MTRRSLRTVVMGPILLVGVATALVVGVAQHWNHVRESERELRHHSERIARELAVLPDLEGDLSYTRTVIELLRVQPGVAAIALVEGTPYRVKMGSQPEWVGEELVKLPALWDSINVPPPPNVDTPWHFVAESLDRYGVLYPLPSTGKNRERKAVLVQVKRELMRDAVWQTTLRAVLFMLGFVGLIGVLLARAVQRNAVQPLKYISAVVDRQAVGDTEAYASADFVASEFVEFGEALNTMVETRNRAQRELQRSESELRLLGQITRIADRAQDFDEALRACCAQICRFLCWPIGHVLLLDENDRNVLRPSNIWHVSCPDLAREFVDSTRAMTFGRGSDLPGRVLERKEPIWIRDCWQEDWFERSAPNVGLVRSAAGFPIFMSREVVAVLELFDLQPREREVRPVALMHNIGLTLGQVLQRRQTHELLVRRNKDLVDAMQVAIRATHAKSSFLANMSHEIRTPVTAILGYTELLEENPNDDDRRDYISTVRRNGEHLLQLINDILDVSKIEAGRLEVERIECSPGEVLEEVIKVMRPHARNRGLELEVHYDEPVPAQIMSDPTRLHQVLLNVISNAIKFTEHGSVKVFAGLSTEPDSPCPLLHFVVEDTGIGVADDKMGRLFRPFSQADMSTTRRFGGTGLGLSISKSLVELLGGELTAESVEGEGSRFTFTVQTGPLAGVTLLHSPNDLPRARTPYPMSGKKVRLDGLRVLLAEDGKDNQKLIRKILTLAGAEVEIVENGLLAIECALAARESGQAFDTVLMDMQMPVMDGYDATRRLRKQGYKGRIFALTANAMKGDREKCISAGCDEFLSKPINRQALIRAIAQRKTDDLVES